MSFTCHIIYQLLLRIKITEINSYWIYNSSHFSSTSSQWCDLHLTFEICTNFTKRFNLRHLRYVELFGTFDATNTFIYSLIPKYWTHILIPSMTMITWWFQHILRYYCNNHFLLIQCSLYLFATCTIAARTTGYTRADFGIAVSTRSK